MRPPVWSILAGATLRDRLAAGAGAAIGLALVAAICAMLPVASTTLPVVVAPLGASAVLVFAVPASPLAQPWPVIGGNILSTLFGAALATLVPNQPLAAGLAVGGAILLMSSLRCLHPPGGAAALTAVIGGPAVHAAGFSFAFLPVGINSILLVLTAVVFHRWSAHSYPHRPAPPVPVPGLNLEDIDAALADMHDSFDIAREDLDALLTRAEVHAVARRSPGR